MLWIRLLRTLRTLRWFEGSDGVFAGSRDGARKSRVGSCISQTRRLEAVCGQWLLIYDMDAIRLGFQGFTHRRGCERLFRQIRGFQDFWDSWNREKEK